MPLDEEARLLIEAAEREGIPPYHSLSVQEARRVAAVRAKMVAVDLLLASVEDRTLSTPGEGLPVRIYTPVGEGPFPVLVYFHGGGWVIGNTDSVDHVCRALAYHAGCVVISVDYRQAPEHKFPAAAEDAYAAVCWAASNAADLRGDSECLSVAGDSAGGNLATAAALMVRDRGGPRLALQVLLCPILNFAFDTLSYRENAEGYLLTEADMRWFWGHYLASEADGSNPYASPLRAESVAGLPPALIITAEYDPLRDEAAAYGARLRDAAVPVEVVDFKGTVHGFITRYSLPDKGKKGIAVSVRGLRQVHGHL